MLASIYHDVMRTMDLDVHQDDAIVNICIHDREHDIVNLNESINLKSLEDLRQDIAVEAVGNILSRNRDPEWTLTQEYYFLFDRKSEKDKETMLKRDCILGRFSKRRYELSFDRDQELNSVQEL